MSKYNQKATIDWLDDRGNRVKLLQHDIVQRWVHEYMSCDNDGGTLATIGQKGFDHISNKYDVYTDTLTETKDCQPNTEGRVWWKNLSEKENVCHEVRFIISDPTGRGSSKDHLKDLNLDGISALIPHDTLFKRDKNGDHVYLANGGDRFELTKENLKLFMRYIEC